MVLCSLFSRELSADALGLGFPCDIRERGTQPLAMETRRFLCYVVSLSIFLVVFYCSTLLKSGSNPLRPESVCMLVFDSKTPEVSSKTEDRNTRLNSLLPPTSVRPRSRSTTTVGVRRNSNNNKDQRVPEEENREVCDSDQALLKVYMYDLPPEFHFGLLGWKGKRGQIWPDVGDISRIPSYPGGLNLQHSVEYWLTLDLLSSNSPGIARPCTAVRVMNSSLADVIFVPFFSSLSYNRHSKLRWKGKASRDRVLQDKLVNFLMNQEEWKRGGGKDHLIVAHHPNSMLEARNKLGSAMFLLADFGRYPVEIANLKKDIIAPYRHVVPSVVNDSRPFKDRSILAYFKGAIYRKDGGMIRYKLYQVLKDEKDVSFTYGSVRENGIRSAGSGMASSKFCINIAGDTPSSNRLFDAIVSHCVPIVISDEIELPFEDVLDYSEYCIFVRASDAVKKGFLVNLLRGVKEDEWTIMWERLKQIAHHFEYQYPSQQGDSVQMIWEAVARKISLVRLKLHKDNRFHRSEVTK